MEPAKHIFKRFVEELWNARRLDVADQIFSEDCVTHQLRSGVLAEPARRGPQAVKEHVSGWLMSFSRFALQYRADDRRARPRCEPVSDGRHASGDVDGNFADGQKITYPHDHDTPHRKQQDCRGLGIGGIARPLSTARRAPWHGRIDPQLCSACRFRVSLS